jgi:hypothetical protein
MSIQSLSEMEVLQGSFSLIFVSISLIIGLRIISKSFKMAEKSARYKTVGLTYIFLSSAWWGAAGSFLLIIITGTALSEFLYVFIANAFIFLAVVFWLYSFFHFKTIQHNKLLWHLSLLILSVYEVFFLLFFFNDYRSIAIMTGKFNTKRSLFTLLFDIIAILVSLITGILFSLDSLKSDTPKVVWKGRFLIIAFTSFAVGATFDAFLLQNPITLVIVRLILTFSAISYYFGFFLPDKIANRLIK